MFYILALAGGVVVGGITAAVLYDRWVDRCVGDGLPGKVVCTGR